MELLDIMDKKNTNPIAGAGLRPVPHIQYPIKSEFSIRLIIQKEIVISLPLFCNDINTPTPTIIATPVYSEILLVGITNGNQLSI